MHAALPAPIDADAQDGRGRLALSRHLRQAVRIAKRSTCGSRRSCATPKTLLVRHFICSALDKLPHPASLVDRDRERTRHAVVNLDPHVGIRWRDGGTEWLGRVPHGHDWHTVVEERLVPPPERDRRRGLSPKSPGADVHSRAITICSLTTASRSPPTVSGRDYERSRSDGTPPRTDEMTLRRDD